MKRAKFVALMSMITCVVIVIIGLLDVKTRNEEKVNKFMPDVQAVPFLPENEFRYYFELVPPNNVVNIVGKYQKNESRARTIFYIPFAQKSIRWDPIDHIFTESDIEYAMAYDVGCRWMHFAINLRYSPKVHADVAWSVLYEEVYKSVASEKGRELKAILEFIHFHAVVELFAAVLEKRNEVEETSVGIMNQIIRICAYYRFDECKTFHGKQGAAAQDIIKAVEELMECGRKNWLEIVNYNLK